MRISKNILLTVILALLCAVSMMSQQTGSNYVIIRVSPADAQIEIDSVKCRTTDGVAQCILPSGTHHFRASAPQFNTEEGTFEISPAFRTELKINLVSHNTLLHISSHTKDAELSLNGNIIQGPEWEGYVVPGTHTVCATKPGFQPFEMDMEVFAGGHSTFVIPELKKAKGSINIAVMPVDAEVYVDGVRKGLTPMVINDLDIGKYKIEIKKPDYSPISRTVRVKEEQQTNLTGSLIAYECVDLGLSVLWATFNVGTTNPAGEGEKVCWGATSPSENSPFYDRDISWFRDIQCLYVRYDFATQTWGEGYRIPSDGEWLELSSRCIWEYATLNGVSVARVTGPNGRSIILPVGSYWTSRRYNTPGEDGYRAIDFKVYGTDGKIRTSGSDTDHPQSYIHSKYMVRPVMDKPKVKKLNNAQSGACTPL